MSQVHGPVDSRVVPKSWSSGRILTETQRHQKRNKDRINKERRRKKDEREKKEFRSKLHALEQQLYNPLGKPC
jgi:hypothetical protein